MNGHWNGKVAAITGAASGIGRAVALELDRRGVSLALADWDEQGLHDTRALLQRDAFVTQVDVGDRQQMAAFAAGAADAYGTVHQIYNIAGLGGGATHIADESYDQFERMFAVNVWGVIHGTKEFLPYLLTSCDGHVINISSLNGIMAQPGIGAYCTSKFAVRGFTEALRAELLLDRAPVRVTVVHPGGVRTAIRDAKPVHLGGRPGDVEAAAAFTEAARRRNEIYKHMLFILTADEAARQIVRGVDRKKGRVLLGQARFVDRLVRAIPEHYPKIVAAWSRKTFQAT